MTGLHFWMWTKLLSNESTTAWQRCWKRWVARSLQLVNSNFQFVSSSLQLVNIYFQCSIFCHQFTPAGPSILMFNISRRLRRPKSSPDGLSWTSIFWTTWRTICRSQNYTKMFPPHCTWWTMFTGTLHNLKSTFTYDLWLTGVPTTPHRGTTSSAFTTRSMCLPYIITFPQGV